jgi:hypothetical protein
MRINSYIQIVAGDISAVEEPIFNPLQTIAISVVLAFRDYNCGKQYPIC